MHKGARRVLTFSADSTPLFGRKIAGHGHVYRARQPGPAPHCLSGLFNVENALAAITGTDLGIREKDADASADEREGARSHGATKLAKQQGHRLGRLQQAFRSFSRQLLRNSLVMVALWLWEPSAGKAYNRRSCLKRRPSADTVIHTTEDAATWKILR